MRLRVACLWLMPALAFAQAAGESLPSGEYEISAQIVMPNLEDNLRYTQRHERRCIRADEWPQVFATLRHESFAGCTLGRAVPRGDAVQYPLSCESAEVASGAARLTVLAGRVDGELKVKMGGKNMTFSERVSAVRVGDCSPVN